MTLVDKIKNYYDRRGLKWPNFSDAMKFVHTELAEVYELDLDRIGGFVRNHPENKPKFNKERLSEELGDAIFMLMVAGIVEGVDPLQSLEEKMERKLIELREKQIKSELYSEDSPKVYSKTLTNKDPIIKWD